MPRKSLKFSENIKIKFYEQPNELAEEKVETQTHQQQWAERASRAMKNIFFFFLGDFDRFMRLAQTVCLWSE